MLKRKKTLTLIEVLVAATVFSTLSVSLYLLLRSGIRVRKRIEIEQSGAQNIYLNLERIAQEIRSIVFFREGDPGFKGSQTQLELYTLLFDYSANCPKIYHIVYHFDDGKLSKTIKEPFSEEGIKTFTLFNNLETFVFSYFDKEKEEWFQDWEEREDLLPKGVKIELEYKDEGGKVSSFTKHIFIH